MKAFAAPDGLKVLVAHAGDRYYAYQAKCPHMEVPLEEGFYDGSVITCHQHLWQWEVRTGAPIGLAEAPLERYDLVEEDGVLYVVPAGALGQAALFSGIAPDALETILTLARRRVFDEGTVLYRPGDPAEDLYVLESGRVEFVIGRDDRTSPAGFILRAGEVFGWNALLDDQLVRIATATCLERSTLHMIDGRELLRFFEEDPRAGYLVMRRLSSLITHHLTPAGAR